MGVGKGSQKNCSFKSLEIMRNQLSVLFPNRREVAFVSFLVAGVLAIIYVGYCLYQAGGVQGAWV